MHLLRRMPPVVVVVAACSLIFTFVGCDASSVRRPIRRSELYRTTLEDYKAATVLPSATNEFGTQMWRVDLPADSRVRATVSGPVNMGVIRVNYPDESEPRLVYPPQDYTNNLEVRVKGSTLYVSRAVTLLWTEYRLAVYDLGQRNLKVDLLVAPEDMPPHRQDR
jgi:hypothetical protein